MRDSTRQLFQWGLVTEFSDDGAISSGDFPQSKTGAVKKTIADVVGGLCLASCRNAAEEKSAFSFDVGVLPREVFATLS